MADENIQQKLDELEQAKGILVQRLDNLCKRVSEVEEGARQAGSQANKKAGDAYLEAEDAANRASAALSEAKQVASDLPEKFRRVKADLEEWVEKEVSDATRWNWVGWAAAAIAILAVVMALMVPGPQGESPTPEEVANYILNKTWAVENAVKAELDSLHVRDIANRLNALEAKVAAPVPPVPKEAADVTPTPAPAAPAVVKPAPKPKTDTLW